MDSLAIVIPFYNESACLPGLIAELDDLIEKIDADLTVYAVNDGSKDQTLKLLNEFAASRAWLKVIDQKNGGHGSAILNGYKQAIKNQHSWIFQCDSDQQIPLSELPTLWKLRQKDTTILGVRTNRQDPNERLLVSLVLRLILKVLFNVSIRDANCPFRLYPLHNLSSFLIHIPDTTFAPNVFLSVMAKSTSALQETFVSHLPRTQGTNSINRINLLKVCFRCTGELMNFWRSKESWPKLQHTRPYSS